jgi:TolA-binding protein/Tfp pilus assembly protein PilF
MLSLIIAAAVAAQIPQGTQAVARTLAAQPPGRDPTLLHRHADRIIESAERAQEQALRKLVDQGGPEVEQAEVLARLAATLRARALALTIASQSEPEGSSADGPQGNRAKAAQMRAEAIVRYRELLRRFPRWQRQDEALFFLADTLQDSGKDDEAVQVARELTSRFPQSAWAPDSHVFLGEHLFERAKVDEALREYRAAAEVPSAEVYPYALYKAAWCRFNQGGFSETMKLLHQVALISTERAGKPGTGGPEASKVQLAREARRDYVLAYSRVGKPEAGRDEFSRLFGKENGLHMLEMYARLLFDTGRDVECQTVSRQLLELHGDSAGAALDQTRLLQLAARSGKRREIIREAQALADVFTRVRVHEQATLAQREALAEADRLAEETLRELAVRSHNEAKKTGLDDAFAAGKALYADYLALFPDASAAYDLRFFDAELLYGLSEKPRAAALYEQVVRQDLAAQQAGKRPGRWEDRAAWGAVLARDESAREGQGTPKQGKAVAPKASAERAVLAQRPLTAREDLLARSCDLYLTALPSGSHAVEVAFKLGRLRYLSGEFKEARERLAWVATQHPEHELAEYAANLVLDIENLQHDLGAVHAWAVRFLADKRLVAHGTLAQDLVRVREESAYAIADSTAGDEAKASALIAFASAYARGVLTDKALFGAAAALSRLGRIDEALEARARIWREIPRSGLVGRALLASAADRAQVGDFGESAALLERYAALYRKQVDAAKWLRAHPAQKHPRGEVASFDETRAKAALHDAALLREARGELKLALADRTATLALWKTASDRDDTELAAAHLEAKLGYPTQAARKLSALAMRTQAKPSRSLIAWRDAARGFARGRESGNVLRAWTELEKSWRSMGPKAREKAGSEAASAAAEAHLALGNAAFEQYRRQRIEPPLLRTLSRKVALLQTVKKRDEEVVALREAEPAVCALAQLGEAQVMLAQGIAQSPPPAGLNADERKQYSAQLGDKAQPLLAEAGKTLRDASARARELGVSGTCVAKVQALLRQLGDPAAARTALPEMPPELSPAPGLLDADASRPAAAGDGNVSERARRLLAEALQAAQASAFEATPDVVGRFRAVLSAAPSWSVAQLDLATMLDRQGAPDEAEKMYRQVALAAVADEARQAAAARAATLALARGDGKAALLAVEGAQHALPGALWPLELRAEVELSLRDDRAAQRAARAVLTHAPKSIAALCALARAQLSSGFAGTARLLALRAAEAAPRDARPHLVFAAVARQNDEPASELSALKAAAAADPRSAAAAQLLGEALHGRGLEDDALAQLTRATQLAPRDAGPHLGLGALLAALGRPARAVDELDLAARLAPHAAQPHLELARLHLDAEQDPKSALAEAEKFLQLSPTPPPAGHPVYLLVQRCDQALKGHGQAPVVQETRSEDK